MSVFIRFHTYIQYSSSFREGCSASVFTIHRSAPINTKIINRLHWCGMSVQPIGVLPLQQNTNITKLVVHNNDELMMNLLFLTTCELYIFSYIVSAICISAPSSKSNRTALLLYIWIATLSAVSQ